MSDTDTARVQVARRVLPEEVRRYRVDVARRMLANGYSVTDSVRAMRDRYGISGSHARRLVYEAMGD